MQKSGTIQYLKNDEIDRQKWDECITSSTSPLIYARSFYLDNMVNGWSALVGENYDWVFPITSKRKYGISYLYQPPLCQQLGIFSKPTVSVPSLDILEWLKKRYRFWEINCNYATKPQLINSAIESKAAVNFILDLSKGYDTIAANYHKDLVKNIKRSSKFNLEYQDGAEYDKCIELFKMHYADRLSNTKENDYKNFSNICTYALKNNMLLCKKVVDNRNELMSMAIILNEGNRLYNLMNVTTEAGRNTEANHFLLNSIIKEYSGQNLIFDFEGSDIPGIKHFYENFGPVNQPYHAIKYNNLPWPIKLMK